MMPTRRYDVRGLAETADGDMTPSWGQHFQLSSVPGYGVALAFLLSQIYGILVPVPAYKLRVESRYD